MRPELFVKLTISEASRHNDIEAHLDVDHSLESYKVVANLGTPASIGDRRMVHGEVINDTLT